MAVILRWVMVTDMAIRVSGVSIIHGDRTDDMHQRSDGRQGCWRRIHCLNIVLQARYSGW